MLLSQYRSELLARLQQVGFEQWYTVKPSGFFAALGFGLLMHTFPRYAQIEEFMVNTWRPMAQRIAEFDRDKRGSNSDAICNSPYWQMLNQECMVLCRNLLPPDIDPKAGGYSAADSVLYQSLVDCLHLSLYIYELKGGNECHVNYRCQSKKEPALIVCIAAEAECVSVLIHKDFQPEAIVEQASFPYYELNEEVKNSEERKLISALSSLSNDISTLLLSTTQSFPPTLQPVCDSLRSSLTQINTLLASTQFQIPLNVSALEEVLMRQSRQQNIEQGQIIQWRGHSVHQKCLKKWQQLAAGFDSSNTPSVCQTCSEILLQEIAHRGCVACANQVLTITFTHGCNLCLKCCAESWYLKSCLHCHRELALTEWDEIKRFYDSNQPNLDEY